MLYHILEVQNVDKDGKQIPQSEFFIVDSNGERIAGPFNDLLSAIRKLQELEKLEAEKSRTKDAGQGR